MNNTGECYTLSRDEEMMYYERNKKLFEETLSLHVEKSEL